MQHNLAQSSNVVQLLRIFAGDKKKMGTITAEVEEDKTDFGKRINSP